MLGVAVHGTAAGVAPLDYPVAMKTGTAAAWRAGYHVNYVGVAPARDPEVAFCVRVTHAPSSPLASRAGREVLAALLQGLAARRRLEDRAALARPRP
jgi:cell division protein FtsI/penicillin-binding protein 2